jgi:hypothetical protein
MANLGEWLEETHATGFELRRHFFLRFFDSDLVSTPGQWQVVAGGALAVLLSLSLIYTQAYYHKYFELNGLEASRPARLAILADALFLIVLAMFLIGLFTTLLWPQLFPGLRDYLALASLPVRLRDVFVAKFSALVAFAGLFVVATTFLPSIVMPAVMTGRHVPDAFLQVPAIFVSTTAAAWFVFFALVAAQGALLNLVPVRYFPRISLAAQGGLLTALLCGLPLALTIPGLQSLMDQSPDWVVCAPPMWFLGLHQVIDGNREPLALRLAWLSGIGTASAGAAAALTYLWSFHRHRVRILESPSETSTSPRRDRFAGLAERLIPEPPDLGVFAFIVKTLGRSRPHRLALTAFTGVAIAIIFDGFVSLALSRGFRGFSVVTPALRRAVIATPLALSLFVLAGYRYLFRLPVELRANWLFRVNELGNIRLFLAAIERFLLYGAVAPVALATLPLEMALLGARAGLGAAILCLLPAVILMEALLAQFEKIPFTSSYLPGQRPVIETLLIYGLSVVAYVFALSGAIAWCLTAPISALGLFVVLVAIWLRVRKGRIENWEAGWLNFEELPEPAVQVLGIQRD